MCRVHNIVSLVHKIALGVSEFPYLFIKYVVSNPQARANRDLSIAQDQLRSVYSSSPHCQLGSLNRK